jgi:hypothetical protein
VKKSNNRGGRKLEENVKLGNYDFAIYQLEQNLKSEIEYSVTEKNAYTTDPVAAYQRGKLNAYKEAPYWLTGDPQWNISLEELYESMNFS